MRGPLSVTSSDIYMVKMENEVVIPSKPIFHKRHKLGENVLLDQLSNYDPNIKLTI